MDTPRTRRGRPPAGQSILSRDAILEAATALIDAGDVEAVSMRTVARALGVDAKSLYNHIANKDALLTGIAESIVSRMEVPAPQGDLATDLIALARAFRAAVLAGHPRTARLLLARPIESMTTLAPMDAALAVFLRAGATPPDAVHYLRTVFAFITGTLLREADSAMTLALTEPAAAAERARRLESSPWPSVRTAARTLATCDHEREYEFGIALLAATIARELDAAA